MNAANEKRFSPRLFFYLFFSQLIYSFAVVNAFFFPIVSGTPYECHAADFSLGFCSKLLPGAIYNLFVSSPSKKSATVYAIVLLLLFFAAVSAMLCAVYTKLSARDEKTFLFLCAFFLFGTCSVSFFAYCPGMLDFYWALSAAAFFAVVKNKYLRYFIPLIAVFAVTCHTGGLLTYVLLFAIVLLYEASREEKGSSRNVYLVLFALTCVFSLLTFVYFTVFDEHNMKLSVPELDEFFEKRGSQSHYYICSFYREEALKRFNTPADMIEALTGGAYAEGSFFEKIYALIRIHFWLYGSTDNNTFIYAGLLLALLFPQLAVIYGYFIGRLKDENENAVARFAFFCALCLVPFVTVVSFFVSTDSIRWVSHSFIMLASFFIYIQYRENGSGLDYIRRCLEKVHPLLLTAYFILYFFTVYNPYD